MPYIILDPTSDVRCIPGILVRDREYRIVWSVDVEQYQRIESMDTNSAPSVPVYALTTNLQWAQEMCDALNAMTDRADPNTRNRVVVNNAPVVSCTLSAVGRGLMHPTEFLYRFTREVSRRRAGRIYATFPGCGDGYRLAGVYEANRTIMPNCNCLFCVRARGSRVPESEIPSYLREASRQIINENSYPWQAADSITAFIEAEQASERQPQWLPTLPGEDAINREILQRYEELERRVREAEDQDRPRDRRTIMPMVEDDYSDRPMPNRAADEPTKEDRVASLRALLGKIDALVPVEKDRTAPPKPDNPREARDLDDQWERLRLAEPGEVW